MPCHPPSLSASATCRATQPYGSLYRLKLSMKSASSSLCEVSPSLYEVSRSRYEVGRSRSSTERSSSILLYVRDGATYPLLPSREDPSEEDIVDSSFNNHNRQIGNKHEGRSEANQQRIAAAIAAQPRYTNGQAHPNGRLRKQRILHPNNSTAEAATTAFCLVVCAYTIAPVQSYH